MDYYAKDGGPWGNMHPGDNAKRVLPREEKAGSECTGREQRAAKGK